MQWNNYDLNETVIPLIQLLKDHATKVLERTYGNVLVDKDDIYSLFLNDVFVYFPLLMQELAITRLIDGYAVGTHDEDNTTFTRTESLNNETNANSTTDTKSVLDEDTTQNGNQKDTGTVKDMAVTSTNQSGETQIVNDTNVVTSNTRSVALTHNLPEQALDNTGNFPVDENGVPIMGTAYAQGASEQYSGGSPIVTDESSRQTSTGANDGTSNNTRTNDLSSTNTATGSRNSTADTNDKTDSKTTNVGNNTITERTDIYATNKQYSYEITNFLSAASTVVAFSNWEDKFLWLKGVM